MAPAILKLDVVIKVSFTTVGKGRTWSEKSVSATLKWVPNFGKKENIKNLI
jgi:hypothetical protein